ncbi:MAG: site-specific DNA-methyltransferase [Candidatus Bathyarchaeia archaeon]
MERWRAEHLAVFSGRISDVKPYYKTRLGCAYLGDAYELCSKLPDESVNLIVTSPPFALVKKKRYGNKTADRYIAWFSDFARQFERILTAKGSLVVHVGGSWNKGRPTRTLYNFKLLLDLATRFNVAQEFYWYNPAKLPSPAQWVTIKRVRVKDAVDPIWWFSKDSHPKATNRRVLVKYSESMRTLLSKGYNSGRRPSGHTISDKGFSKDQEGAIPSNLLTNLLSYSNTESTSRYMLRLREAHIAPHPARWPWQIPKFFIDFLTEKGDMVLDPFGGSNTTGAVAETLGRRWMSFEIVREYVRGSRFRFESLR